MRKQSLLFLLILAALASTWQGCRTDFDVYAPEKEYRVVFGVLNPNDSVQYIRLATAYQFEGDALVYAAENDLSLSGQRVTLIGNGNTWTAEEVANYPKDSSGLFIPNQTIYKFVTDGSAPEKQPIEAGIRYRLEIGAPDAGDFVSAETTVPGIPQIRGELTLISGAGSSVCLPDLFLERKWQFHFRRLDPLVRYEIRVRLTFAKDGVDQTIQWGPTDLFQENRRCNEGSASVCYQFAEKQLLTFFNSRMPDDGSAYTYDDTDCVPTPAQVDMLSKALEFEVTSVDEYLGNYMEVNNPKYLDLTGAKPEYTNLSGNVDVVGVFGSINTDSRNALLSQCSAALIGLNGISLPPGCEW